MTDETQAAENEAQDEVQEPQAPVPTDEQHQDYVDALRRERAFLESQPKEKVKQSRFADIDAELDRVGAKPKQTRKAVAQPKGRQTR